MAKGRIRRNETEKVPLKKSIWFIVVLFKEGEINEETYYTTKKSMKKFIPRLESLIEEDNQYQIYAIWNGRYNTDLFEIDPKILKNRLEEKLKNW